MKILVVEDNEYFAAVIAKILEPNEVKVVSTLKEAKNALKCPKVALAIVDLSLPDSHGTQTLAALDAKIPVIVITGNPNLACEAAHMGVMDFIVKDGDNARLVSRIQFNLERLKPRRSRFKAEDFEQIKACLAPIGA